METKKSGVIIAGGLLPVGWPRKVFFSPEDNGAGIITILKMTPYMPTKEKLEELKEHHPDTYATIKHEKFLTVNLLKEDFSQIRRTIMLSQYVKALKEADLPLFGPDGETLLHGYKARINKGELIFLNPANYHAPT